MLDFVIWCAFLLLLAKTLKGWWRGVFVILYILASILVVWTV